MGTKATYTLEPKEKEAVPGPGNYEPRIVDRRVVGQSFGTSHSPQIPLSLQEKAGVPGPGGYEVDKNAFSGKKAAARYSFGTIGHETSVKKTDKPGPGQYLSLGSSKG